MFSGCWICELLFLWKQPSIWILSSAVTFAAGVLWFLDTILFNVQRSLPLCFGCRPLFLSADDVIPWSVYAIIPLGTAALVTPSKVAFFLLQTLQLNAHLQSVVFEYLTSLRFCSAFIPAVTNTIWIALTLAHHSAKKQNNDRYSWLMFFQCSQHKQFHFYII